MKRIFTLLLALICLAAFASCEKPESEETNTEKIESVESYRTRFIGDNTVLTANDTSAGKAWIEAYAGEVFPKKVSNIEYSDHFTTDRLVSGKSVCFSSWKIVFEDGSETVAVVTEVIDENGDRYLSDIYELTGAVKNATVDYAYSRLRLDARYASLCTGNIENECGEGVKCFSITDAVPQSVKYTLLVDESVKDGKLYYGSYNSGKQTYDVNVTAEISSKLGVGTAVTRYNTYPRGESVVYLMNKSYKVMYSEETGDLVTVNRKYDETVLCETVNSDGDDRLIPVIFDSFDDQVLVFTMLGKDDAVIGYGIYDSETQLVTKYKDGNYPMAVKNGILYHMYKEDGVGKIGYTDLLAPEKGATPLGEINSCESVKNGSVKVSISADGKHLALAETDSDGVTHLRVYSSDGSPEYERTLKGYFCDPKYVGFLENGDTFMLCDKKLLCDEYIFIASAPEED